jgi:selenide,water dikinase
MAAASGVTIRIDARHVPLFDGVRSLVPNNVPGGGRSNAQHFGGKVEVTGEVDEDLLQLLHDPQTSGGLLVSVDGAAVGECQRRLEEAGCPAWRIGRVEGRSHASVTIG